MNMLRYFLFCVLTSACLGEKLPNFVFLVSEDNSIHYLKHYGAKFGAMPHLE